jgi:predicted dinucleotide-binding enzyme
MNVTIIGTGNMARGIGARVLAGGHEVTVLGKEATDAEAVVADLGDQGSAKAGRSGDPIADDVVVLAVYYPDAQAAVEQYGDALSGTILVDITNPVNDTFDGLVTPPDGSAAQELAKGARGARVVKAFNTTFANTLREGRVADHTLDVFIAGDDDDAQGHRGEAGRRRRVAAGGRRRAEAGAGARGCRPAAHECARNTRHRLRQRAENRRLGRSPQPWIPRRRARIAHAMSTVTTVDDQQLKLASTGAHERRLTRTSSEFTARGMSLHGRLTPSRLSSQRSG